MSIIEGALFDARKISEIQRGEFLCTTGEHLGIEGKSLTVTMSRTIYHDSRSKALKRIDRCIKSLVEFSDVIMESRYLDVFRAGSSITPQALAEYTSRVRILIEISEALALMIKGLTNFSITYTDDSDVSSRIEKFIKRILSHTSKIQNFLSELQKIRDAFEAGE